MKIVVDGLPWVKDLSWNHCRMGPGGNWHLKKHVESWMERLAWDIIYVRRYGLPASGIPPVEFSLPVHVIIDFRFPDKRKRDDHNYYKVICDAVASGLGIDDKHIRIRTGSVVVDRENPGFAIEVSDGKQEPDHSDSDDDLASLDQ